MISSLDVESGSRKLWMERYYNLLADKHNITTEHIEHLLSAEQENRLIVLPCKVGDTVWRIVGRGTNGHKDVQQRKVLAVTIYHTGDIIIHTDGMENEFGKTVFSTREEAESALGGVEHV